MVASVSRRLEVAFPASVTQDRSRRPAGNLAETAFEEAPIGGMLDRLQSGAVGDRGIRGAVEAPEHFGTSGMEVCVGEEGVGECGVVQHLQGGGRSRVLTHRDGVVEPDDRCRPELTQSSIQQG